MDFSLLSYSPSTDNSLQFTDFSCNSIKTTISFVSLADSVVSYNIGLSYVKRITIANSGKNSQTEYKLLEI